MTFRFKLALVILAVGLVPSLLVITGSAYLVILTLNRISSAGLESSMTSAEKLVDDARGTAGLLLKGILRNRPFMADSAQAANWMKINHLDLVIETNNRDTVLAISDSLPRSALTALADMPLRNGPSILMVDSVDFLIYASIDSLSARACGILLPEGYGRRGKELAQGLSASASLGIIKTLSVRLLLIVTATAIVMSVVLAITLSGILSRRLARPLAELTRGAEIIGGGNLNHRVTIIGEGEFAKLGESFNRMAIEIRENQRQLMEAERLAAWREVARRIAHEIRNPLTPLFVQLYRIEQELAEGQGSPQGLEAIEAAKAQLDILQGLASQFSTFAKEPELKPVHCSIGDIIDGVIRTNDFGPTIEITTDIKEPIPALNLDPQMMARAIGNLLKNANEAMPGGGEIYIILKSAEEKLELTIRDNGPGFPSEKLAHIDQPYLTSKPTGTGLGLIIVKKIVEEHGGSIAFYNDGGAVVKITLPIC